MNKKTSRLIALRISKLIFILGCLGGFLYQTFEFLFLYWTYPTVVDIQQIEPSYLDMPAFSICNTIGYDFDELCRGFKVSPCLPNILISFSGSFYCTRFPEVCFDNKPSRDLQIITYTKFMQEVELSPADHDKLRIKLKHYMNCTIEFAGEETPCDLDNVMGSLYSKEDLPQYCYSIYSLWGQPNKKRAKVPKGAVMRFSFNFNTSLRPDPPPPDSIIDGVVTPKYNIPGNPSIQIAVHSPYFLPSPFLDGMSYIAGRAYELRLKMSERHLLPPPYQTNCTDYMKMWRERGGKAPINQMSLVQECRVNKTYESIGCIPINLDYPHTYNICKSCHPDPCNYSTFAEECGKLTAHYNQPCDSLTYDADREDRVITKFDAVESGILGIRETVRRKILAYECEGNRLWTKDCATIDVYVLFDRFEITNLTYIPKFESLELFSSIGGYMGMWLGVSLLSAYDFIGSIILAYKAYKKKKRETTKIQKMKKPNNKISKSYHQPPTMYRTMADYYGNDPSRDIRSRWPPYDMQ